VSVSNLEGRKALVTGGGSGIGLATARHLAGLGAHVTIADIDADAAESAAAEVGGSAWTVDLSDTDGLCDAELDVDILVNNAGIQHVAALPDFDPGAFRAIQRIMVEAPFLLIRAALPRMYQRGWGRVVNVSSVHGLRASAFKSAYVSAKHALEGLSKVTALEGAEHGVTSNCINPGYVRTPLVEKQIADQAKVHGLPENEVVEKVMLTESAVKKMVEPEQVASLVGWVCSDAAGMVTGASYTMDGGWTAR
jgi:3-hydroxybutyrate dehydrogenase